MTFVPSSAIVNNSIPANTSVAIALTSLPLVKAALRLSFGATVFSIKFGDSGAVASANDFPGATGDIIGVPCGATHIAVFNPDSVNAHAFNFFVGAILE